MVTRTTTAHAHFPALNRFGCGCLHLQNLMSTIRLCRISLPGMVSIIFICIHTLVPLHSRPMQAHTDIKPQKSNIAVVIPHLNKIAETRNCCESLARQSPLPATTIIVDNGSTVHTEDELAAACPSAEILRLECNRGFAGGVNAGIRKALSNEAITHVLILNNDTICPSHTLEQLLAESSKDPANGITGCPLIEGEGASKILVPPGKKCKGAWLIPYPVRGDEIPDYLSGTCLLINKKVFLDIGLFDENFFFYWEDADFCLRAKQNGWKLASTDKVTIQHLGSSTARCYSELLAEGYRSGHRRFLHKYTRHPLARAIPPFLFRLFSDVLSCRWASVRGNLKGFLHSPQQQESAPPFLR
jgi:GT2 family glycosyltransferase